MTRVTDAVRSVKPEAEVDDYHHIVNLKRVIVLRYGGCSMKILMGDADRSAFLARAIVALNALQDEVEGR